MTKILRCAISGGPGVGKSSLIEELKKRGYQVVPETSTMLIKEALAQGKENPAKDQSIFGPQVLHQQKEQERSVDSARLTFFDRSFIDGAFYYDYFAGNVPQEQKDAIAYHAYDLAFFLDIPLIHHYDQTAVRYEDQEVAFDMHTKLLSTYKTYMGEKNIVMVSSFNRKLNRYAYETLDGFIHACVQARADFIVNYIQHVHDVSVDTFKECDAFKESFLSYTLEQKKAAESAA